VLNGDLGNFTVSYDGFGALPDLFRRGRWVALSRLLFDLSRRGHRLRAGLHKSIGPFLPLVLYRLIRRLAGREAVFELLRDSGMSPELAAAANLRALAAERDWDMSYRPWADGRRMRLACIGRVDIGPLHAATNARFGVDLRDPTVDRRLIELCLAIPEEHFLRHGRQSAVFCDAMEGVLPGWLLKRRHRGLQSADWYEGLVAARSELIEHVERLARSPLGSRALDIARLRDVLAALPDPATPPEALAKGAWGTPQAHRSYGAPLLRAMNIGHFIMRTEGGNR
jgi:asparagine synthase (glutamine-hydrolysing)